MAIVDDFRMPLNESDDLPLTAAWSDAAIAWDYASFPIVTIEPPACRNFIMTAPDGRAATIGFDGPEVTFSGDLPVGNAARLFFESVFEHVKYKSEREKGK